MVRLILPDGTSHFFSPQIPSTLADLCYTAFPKLNSGEYFFKSEGKILNHDVRISSMRVDSVCEVALRCRGGKGGFGSMLRAIGSQIEKTTNKDMCRDLNGRRLRDVKNEKKLREWLKGKAERDAETRRRRREKLQSIIRGPRTQEYRNPEYYERREQVVVEVSDSVSRGMQVGGGSGGKGCSQGVKRTAVPVGGIPRGKKTKSTLWLGVDDIESSSDDENADRPSCSYKSISRKEDVNTGKPVELSDGDFSDLPVGNTEEVVDKLGDKATSGGNAGHFDVVVTETKVVFVEESENETDKLIKTIETPSDFLTLFESVDSVELLDLNQLKRILQQLGMKCGGTHRERSDRLHSVRSARGVIPHSLKAKQSKGKTNNI